MSEEVLLLNNQDIRNIKSILLICKAEFIRDKKQGRPTLFNELTLLDALQSMKMPSWCFGDHDIKLEKESKK